MTQESGAKFEEKLTCYLENDMRNWENFSRVLESLKSWDIDGILFSKKENL